MPDIWTAIYTPTSANSGHLNVNGQCLSIGGETFTLRKHHAQESKPGTLLLDKIDHTPPGIVHNDVARTVSVTYEEDIQNEAYSKVEILPDGVTIAVKQLSSAASS